MTLTQQVETILLNNIDTYVEVLKLRIECSETYEAIAQVVKELQREKYKGRIHMRFGRYKLQSEKKKEVAVATGGMFKVTDLWRGWVNPETNTASPRLGLKYVPFKGREYV